MLAEQRAPIVAVATPPGRGAVGIVRASGEGLRDWVTHLCGRELQPRVATYLPLRDAQGEVLDHVLALYFPAPHSYTGEDVLELQAHGGPVVMQLLLARALQSAQEVRASDKPWLAGLRLAQPGEFTRRAFLNHKLDLAQAEAVADLIDASTEAAARSASRALAGALSQAVARLNDDLVQLRMLVEATLDFPEEEIDFLQKADAQGQLQRLNASLDALLAQTRQGVLLREGLRVVIAGQPNAGKSSLLNALAGAELAIVTPIAGTTRDVVQQALQIDGVPLHVVDTAGLREGDEVDAVERIGIDRAWEQIRQADAVLFLHDLTRAADRAYQAADAEIAERLAQQVNPQVPVLHLWNKADLVQEGAPREGLLLSAREGTGLQALRQQLLQTIGWQGGGAGEGVFMARERHVQALQRAQSHLQRAHALLQSLATAPLDLLAEELRLAHQALAQIVGEFTADDLLGVIFSRFCIGK